LSIDLTYILDENLYKTYIEKRGYSRTVLISAEGYGANHGAGIEIAWMFG